VRNKCSDDLEAFKEIFMGLWGILIREQDDVLEVMTGMEIKADHFLIQTALPLIQKHCVCWLINCLGDSSIPNPDLFSKSLEENRSVLSAASGNYNT
jgi:hypothetical protein